MAARLALLALLFSCTSAIDEQREEALNPSSWSSTTLDVQVEPQTEQCYFEDVVAGAPVEVTVLVHRGGKLDITLRVEAPGATTTPVYSQLLFSNINDATGHLLPTIVKKGTKFVAASTGTYSICLDNRVARWTAKVLTLDVRVGPKGAQQGFLSNLNSGSESVTKPATDALAAADGDGTSPSSAAAHLATMRRAAWATHHRLNSIIADAQYARTRSNRHHMTLVSTEVRLVRWSLLELVVIMLSSGLQVLLVQRWFAEGGEGDAPLTSGRGRRGSGSTGSGGLAASHSSGGVGLASAAVTRKSRGGIGV